MILITAATGQVGGAAARALVASGVHVRALVRDRSRAEGLEGAELAVGSYEDAASLDRALRGVSVVLLAGRDSPAYSEQIGDVVAAAERSGVGHLVALSAIGATPHSRVELMRNHAEAEERVRGSGAAWTILRPHLYLQNLLRAAVAVRERGVLTAPLGKLALPLVDTRDVGAAAAAVLASPARHAGAAYSLTGAEAVTYASVAAALSQLTGSTVGYDAVAPDDHRAALLAGGTPEWRASDLAAIASAYAPADLAVTPDLPALLGRPARSLAAFLEDHRDVFAAGPGDSPA